MLSNRFKLHMGDLSKDLRPREICFSDTGVKNVLLGPNKEVKPERGKWLVGTCIILQINLAKETFSGIKAAVNKDDQ